MTKSWKLLAVLVLGGAIVAACSSSTSGGAGGTSPFKCGTGSGGGTTSTACTSCEQAHCSAQMTTCFGADYKGGSCAAYVSCLNACDCNNLSCLMACSPGAACESCMNAMDTCTQTNCATECKATVSDAGTDTIPLPEAGTGGCTALKTCCTTVPASGQASCNNVANAGNEANCNTMIGSLQSAGFCK